MQKKRRRNINKQVIILAALVAVGIISFFMYKRLTEKTLDISMGMKILNELEAADTSEIDKKIQEMESKNALTDLQQQEAETGEVSYAAHFKNSYVLGDSVAQELEAYEVLDDVNVIADIGVSVSSAEEHIATVAGLNPQNVFLNYGLNDIQTTAGDTALFKENYKKMLDELKSAVPDAKIYVNSITKVNAKALETEPLYAMNQDYNDVLKELCEEEKVTFIDVSDLVSEDLYEQDGIHFLPDYYKLWAQRMMETAGI